MRDTFRSLSESRNFRRYFGGQAVSLAGTWMQTVAQGWLVLRLTHSVTQVGLVAAAQTLPVLLIAPFAGVFVDRRDTRKTLVLTNITAALLAAFLGAFTLAGLTSLWLVYVLATGLGFVNALDFPARQALVAELVAPRLLPNAVTLNTVNINVARVVGPAIAAGTIALTDVGPCFLLNAASFVAVVVALLTIRPAELLPRQREQPHRGQLRAGLSYVWRNDQLRVPLIMMTLIGTLTYEFTVTLPALADRTFHGGAATFGLMTGAMGSGAVVGGLLTASRVRRGTTVLARQAIVLGVLVLTVAAAPTKWSATGALTLVGAASLVFLSRANATVQLLAEPAMRGRVMAMWTVAFVGTTPVGAPLVGWIGQQASPRWALAVGGMTAVVAGALGAISQLRARRLRVSFVPAGRRDSGRATAARGA